jgi:hypothetical protein
MGRAGSFPGFRMENTLACFHSAEKCWMERIALKSLTREIARDGSCFRVLFGIPSEPGA